eukprot:c34181_g1_i1 orf=512-1576(-)
MMMPLKLDFQLSRRSKLTARLCVIVAFFPFFLLVAVDVAGRQLEEVDDSISELDLLVNYSSIIQQRQRQDRHFQQQAFTVFNHHKTGQLYNVSSIRGSTIQAVRLRTGSLKKRGIIINEFTIVEGCHVGAPLQRVLLVYERFGTSDLFPVKDGYESIVPVVGLFAYDATNLSTTQALPKLSLATTEKNITVHFPLFKPSADVTVFCVYFEDNSVGVVISNLTSLGSCSTTRLGFFSLIARSLSRASVPAPEPAISSALHNPRGSPFGLSVRGKRSSGIRTKAWKIAVGSAAGILLLVLLCSMLAFAAMKYRRMKRFTLMEYHASQGESLQTALIRNTRAPAAGGTRTQPSLESY